MLANGILSRPTSLPKPTTSLTPIKWIGWAGACDYPNAWSGLLLMSAKWPAYLAFHTDYKLSRRWHSWARHALITSCMRAHAPCQAVDRPSLFKNEENRGRVWGMQYASAYAPSQLTGSEFSDSWFQYFVATYATKVHCIDRIRLAKRWLYFTWKIALSCRVCRPTGSPHHSHPSIGHLLLYQFLHCDMSCCYSTSAMPWVPLMWSNHDPWGETSRRGLLRHSIIYIYTYIHIYTYIYIYKVDLCVSFTLAKYASSLGWLLLCSLSAK